MKFIFQKPKSSKLSKYIEGYYIISKDSFDGSLSYYTFPNNFGIISFFHNAKIQQSEYKIVASKSHKSAVIASLTINYKKPIKVVYNESIDEITIYFKPLALNHFIDKKELLGLGFIGNFSPFTNFEEEMQKVFEEKGHERKIEKLEDYLLTKLQEIDISLLENILKDIEGNVKIEEIAVKYGYTRQYINKLFQKHLGKTPTAYRKIYRFRSSLLAFRNEKDFTRLTYDSNFFDQSHFIKDIKALTDTRPSYIFKNVDIEKEMIWLFI